MIFHPAGEVAFTAGAPPHPPLQPSAETPWEERGPRGQNSHEEKKNVFTSS